MSPGLRALCLRLRGWSLLIGLLLVAAVAATALVLVVCLDVIWILPSSIRAGLPQGLLALAAGALLVLVVQWLRWTPARAARVTQRWRPALGSQLSNAVELARQQPTTQAITEHLRQVAIAQGDDVAAALACGPLHRRRIAAAAFVLCLPLLVLVLGDRLQPAIRQAVWPRLCDPLGDHPPYSRSRIVLDCAQTSVVYGEALEIRAQVFGPAIERLHLIAEDADGRSESLMFRRPDRSFVQTLSNIRAPLTLVASDGRARSHRQRITVQLRPRIVGWELQCHFPAYTGRAPRRIRGPRAEDDLRLPRGTRIELHLTSNRPLRAGSAVLTPILGGDDQHLVLQPITTLRERVGGDFVLETACQLQLGVVDIDGLAVAQPSLLRLAIEPDHPPRIQIIDPAPRAVATAQARVPVHVVISDDFGLGSLHWFRGLNDSVERAVPLAYDRRREGRQGQASSAFDLADLGLRPGDRIAYFFEIADNDPNGPQLATSPVQILEIITEEQYQEIRRQEAARRNLFELEQGLDQRLARLAERLMSPADPAASLQAVANELDLLASAIAQQLTRPQLCDLDGPLRAALRQQAATIARLAAAARSLAVEQQPGEDKLAALRAAIERLAGQATEAIAEPTRHVAAVARLLATAQGFTALTEEQEAIHRQSRRFLDDSDPADEQRQRMALQELTARQQACIQGLEAWQQQVRTLLDALPEEGAYEPLRVSARGFLTAVADADIARLQILAGDFFARQVGRGGHETAGEAAREMRALLGQMALRRGEARQCLLFQPMLTQHLGNSLDQILAAMQGSSGGSGYGLYGAGVALYGSDEPVSGGRERGPGPGTGPVQQQQSASTARPDPALDHDDDAAPPLRLQPEAAFPLRYRDLVGAYFRALADQAQAPAADAFVEDLP